MGYHSVRLRRGSVLAFAVLLVAAVVGTVVLTSQQPVALPAWSLFNKGIPGGEENQRIEFLRKYGWEAEVPPISEEEIVIPAEWDEVYTGYASLQQAQGFNLDKLRGKTVTEYTYHITNYPEKDEVAAHILVYKDRIVGADISEMEQGGFCMEVIPGWENGAGRLHPAPVPCYNRRRKGAAAWNDWTSCWLRRECSPDGRSRN